jgi:hypothetical protein
MNRTLFKVRPFLLLAMLGLLVPSQGLQAQEATEPLTAAERSEYRRTTTYDDLMSFLHQIVERSPKMFLTSMGSSSEGRSIPLVVVGQLSSPDPEAVLASGKTRVYVQGGIHAGEISGKEALLILLREMSNGEHDYWTDSLVLLIAPLYNPDGNERMSPTNRRGQHGPVEGMGERTNAMGLDLNRDQMKLDAPESRALVGVYNRYDPHVAVDLHTTNGSHHGYHLTYAPPLSPSTPASIGDFLRSRWLPQVTRAVKEDTGWDMYYYGGARPARGGMEAGWYTFSHQPRYVSNYIGLRNRFGILGEAYAYASFQERIRISYAFTEEIIEFAYRHAADISRITAEADAQTLVGDSLGVQFEIQRSDTPVTILMGEVTEEENPVSGETMLLRTEDQVPTEMYEFGTFRPTEWATVPSAYLIPPQRRETMDLLEAHGIRFHRLAGDLDPGPVEVFQIDSVETSEREYQGHQAQQVFGRYVRTTDRTLEAGTAVVAMDQPLARLAFTLLEPRSDDGLVAWGLLEGILEPDAPYPILRVGPDTDPHQWLNRSPLFP